MSAAIRGEARARAFVRDHRATLSEWERSSRARHQPGWPTAAEPDRTLKLVRKMPDPLFGLCLIGMLPDLAMWCLYGDLVSRVTILKPCESRLVPVPSAARI